MRTGERRRSKDRSNGATVRQGLTCWHDHCAREVLPRQEQGKRWRGMTMALAVCTVGFADVRLAGEQHGLAFSAPAHAQQQFNLNVDRSSRSRYANRRSHPGRPTEALVRKLVRFASPTRPSFRRPVDLPRLCPYLAGLASLGISLPVGLQGRWDAVGPLVPIDGTCCRSEYGVVVDRSAHAPQQQAMRTKPASRRWGARRAEKEPVTTD